MTPLVIGTIVSLAAGLVALVIGSWLTALVWRRAHVPVNRLAPGLQAHTLAALRLLPAGLACATAALVLVAFIRLEPRDARETLGVVLPALAIVAVTLAVTGGIRVFRASLDTARVVRAWHAREDGAQAGVPVFTIDTAFPVVAVAGIFRPRLYIARRVLEACDAREIDAVIAHESAHVAALDNLTRLLFVCTPVLWFGGVAGEIERAWTMASEQAADDRARTDERRSLALASALTKVARMAAGAPAPLLHASAILSGNGIEHRVRRLLDGQPRRPRTHLPLVLMVVPIAIATLALSPQSLRLMYEAAEYCVRNLP